jgi:nucleoside-diphosphate-sugar epimerase
MREANVPDSVFWEVNVEATRRLLQTAHKAGVGRFVYCSSIGAMGKTPAKPASEESPCEPQDIYQTTKRAAELLCLNFHMQHRLPISIVRPAEVYGPRDRRLLKLFKAISKGTFAMIGSGRNEHHLVYIDDMVQGFRLAAEREEAIGQIFIIAGDRSVTLRDLTRIIAQKLSVKPPWIRIPLLPVRAAAVVVERICAPLGVQPPIYPRRVDFFRSDYSFDITKARKCLGFQPAFDVERGIGETLRWYKERNLL